MSWADSSYGRRSKYGNTWTVVDGIKFQSKLEARRWQQLQLLVKAGEVAKVERQVRFPLVAGITYVADFRVTYPDGRVVIEDVKGVETEAFVIKRKLFEHFVGPLTVLTKKDIR